jgi:hypothetical protein
MRRETLTALTRVRRLACDRAQQTLAACAKAEARALEDLRQAERVIVGEREAVAKVPFGNGLAEAFAAWLPEAHRTVAQARGRHAQAAAATAQARTSLNAARIGVEVVDSLTAQFEDEEKKREEKRAQMELHELISRPLQSSHSRRF